METASRRSIISLYCAILASFMFRSNGIHLRSAPQQVMDPSPLESARNAVNQIATVNQPQSEYLESQPLDVNDKILTNKQGSLMANDNLYTMPDNPDNEVKESNPNNFNAYYAEEKIPEPPPLPKVQENQFQTDKRTVPQNEGLDHLSDKQPLPNPTKPLTEV